MKKWPEKKSYIYDHSWKEGFNKANDECKAVHDEIVRELVEALEALYVAQNGAPLIKYEDEWNRAMELSEQALKNITSEVEDE